MSRRSVEEPRGRVRPGGRKRGPMFTMADRSNIRWFWDGYLKSKTPWLFTVFLMILAQGFVYAQFLALTEDGLRVIFEDGGIGDLLRVCVMVFGVFAFRGVMSYLVPRISVWIASDAIQKLRNDLIDHMMTLDLAYFERTSPGDMILRLMHQADGLSGFVGQSTVKALRDAATVVIVSAYLAWQQPILFAAAASVIPVIFLSMRSVSQGIKEVQASSENAFGAYINGIEEVVHGMRTVKIAGQERMEQDRLVHSTTEIRNLTVRLQAAQAMILPYIDFASAFVYMLVIGGGGYMVLSPEWDVDSAGIIAFLVGLILVFDPARRISSYFISLQASLVLLAGVRSLYDERPTIFDAPGATDTFDRAGDLALENVTFAYIADQPLFDGLSMTFRSGEVSAIVGPTGSGKTTVLSLLSRLYEPLAGHVTIGGTPIRDLKVRALRSAFSVVAQDIVIFNASIFENVRYVRPEATEEEVWEAITAAELLDTAKARAGAKVGPKGAQLSGGQKQRIAIARAFLRPAPIVLLDEATSALDQQTEGRVRTALARLSKDKTTIAVSHRLSSVIDADRIFVMEGGRVIDQGSHADLMARGGLYESLFEAQKRAFDT